MKIIIPPLYERIVDFSKPFAKDAFNRENFANNLTNLFRNIEDGLVITINSKWGDGKTTFIKLWEYQLNQSVEFIPIYYNAFANDFTGDTFLSIAAAIHEAIKEKLKNEGINPQNVAQLDYLKDTSKELAKDLLKMSVGTAIGSLIGGIVENKKIIDWVTNAFKKLFWGTLEVNIDKKFEAHSRAHKTVKEYQSKLQSLLTFKLPGKQPIIRKIVFFIDELDRCSTSKKTSDYAVIPVTRAEHEHAERHKSEFAVDNLHKLIYILIERIKELEK